MKRAVIFITFLRGINNKNKHFVLRFTLLETSIKCGIIAV
jgi:hypothetical protein